MSYLVKIGGSLVPSYARRLCLAIKRYCKRSRQRVFFFPGGGACADIARKYRTVLALSDETTHKMALACLDHNAHLIAGACGLRCVSSLNQLKRSTSFPVVITPYFLLMKRWPFREYSLDIDIFSSDSSAAYFAHILGTQLAIATDVDGVYQRKPSQKAKQQRLLSVMTPEMLSGIKRGGPLDETIGRLLKTYDLAAWVINGRFPQRFIDLFEGKRPKGTLIKPYGNNTSKTVVKGLNEVRAFAAGQIHSKNEDNPWPGKI